MSADSPLLHAKNLYLTPHLAWSDAEARQQIIDTAAANLRSFLEGGNLNRIV
jgi:glycerate dehydrogenase